MIANTIARILISSICVYLCSSAVAALAAPRSLDRIERLLEELTNAFGPVGFEGPVRAIMRRELQPLAARLDTDGLGSLIAVQPGPADSPRIMIGAHMDELGMLVKYITPEGYIRFQTLGGWLDHGLISQRFVIMTRKGPVLGVTGLKTPHVMSADERTRPITRDRMFLDVGAAGRQDAEERLGIHPGDPVAPDSRFALLNDGKLYVAKAWDDRIGLAVIIEVMRRLKEKPAPGSVYGVATVQEEIGLRGAETASHHVRPDVGISIEVGVASDHPGISLDEAQERLGAGPGVFLHDSSMLPNLKLRDMVIDLARDMRIPLQFEVLTGYGQDAAQMQRAFSGAPAINITVPTRYLHNHNGVIHRDDFDRAVDLVTELVRRLDAATVRRLKTFD